MLPLAVALVCSPILSNALANTSGTSIGLKFAATNPNFATSGLSPGDLAGVVPSLNWNNLTNASGSFSGVIADSSGSSVATPVSVTWSSPNTWSSGANNAFPVGPNKKLMSGYLDTGNTTANGAFITVSNLPASFTLAGYDVYVYFLSDSGADRGGGYTITNQSGFVRKYGSTMASSSSFVQDPGTDSNNSLDGNYLRFTSLGGDWFTLKTDTTLTSPNGFRAPVNAIEIVALPCVTAGISVQPTNRTLCAGGNVSFSVGITGSLPTYQWRKNGINLTNGATGNGSTVSGATTATLTITSAKVADSADASSGYDCVVSVACDSSTTNSDRVALTVNALAAAFSVIGGGTNCSEAGAAIALSGSEIGMEYFLRTNGVFNGVQLTGTGLPLSFGYQTANGTYTVLGSNTLGGCTTVMTGSAFVTNLPPPVITSGPAPGAATNKVGETATFSISAAGSGLVYQWYRDQIPLADGGNISGAISPTLTIFPTSVTDTAGAGHGYRCVVNSSCGAVVVSGEALLTVLPVAAPAESVAGVWTNRYHGIGGAEELATRMVIDANSNVIVAGSSDAFLTGRDFLTIKYSSTGTPVWTNRYNGPGNRDDAPQGVTVDSSGNVIVTGYSWNGTNDDYYTAKYDAASGGLIWEQRYNSPSNVFDQAVAVAVDAAGNVLVTGRSARTNSQNDFYTVKYAAANGALLWENRHDGTNHNADEPLAIAVDSNGDAAVTGWTWTGASYDFYTAKYAGDDGALIWERQYDALGDEDIPAAVAMDSGGNVLVAGRSATGANRFDFYVAKYAAATGAILWSKRYSGTSSSIRDDRATAIALDANDNVAITGYMRDAGGRHDMLTTKFAADGTFVWQKSFAGTPDLYDRAFAIAVDSAGNVIVSGGSQNGSNSDFYTLKYAAANGDVLWTNRYNGPGNGDDNAIAVGVDANGDVVILGTSAASGQNDILTLKCAAADGAVVWEQRHDGPGNRADTARCVAVDTSGNVVVGGTSARGNGTTATDFYTAKYSPSGALLWEQRYAGTNDSADDLVALALDGSGNVIVAGSIRISSVGDYYTAKYAAADGALLWEKFYNGTGNSLDEVRALAVDSSGNVIVTGFSTGSGTSYDYYTAKYAAADGALLWEQRYNGPAGSQVDQATAVAVDANDNVIVTGNSYGTNDDYYTAKYAAADGTLLWEKRYNGPGNNVDDATCVALDAAGNVIVTGTSHNGSNYDYYTAKYAAADGALLWEKRFSSPGSFSDSASAVTVDPSGNVIVTGVAQSSYCYTAKYAAGDGAILWEQRLTNNVTSGSFAVASDTAGNAVVTTWLNAGGKTDYLTVKYAGTTGALLWSARYNGPVNGNDQFYSRYSLAIGPSDEIVVAGGSDGQTNYAGTGNRDFLTIKYQTLGFATYANSAIAGTSIDFAPNGGVPPYQFAIATNNSGGSIDAGTGLYIAGPQCGVTDTIILTDANQITATATVRVVSASPPSLVCPTNIIISSALPCSAAVTFAVTATDGCGLPLVPIVSPPSGSQFPLGVTTVNCTAVDDLGRATNNSFTVTVQSSSACAPMPSDVVAFWRGESDAADSIGTNNALVAGAVTFEPCAVNGAGFKFSSLGSYLVAPFSAALQQTNITVEAWVFAQGSPANEAGILGTWNDLGGAGTAWRRTFMVWSYQGKLEFLCGVGGTIDRATDPATLPINTWVHVAGTYDGSTIRLYRNGTEVASKAYSGILNTNDLPFYVGRTDSGGNGPDYWRGMIDDVSVYSRALGSNEIAAIYAAGSAGKCLLPPVLAISPPATNVFAGGAVNFSTSGGQPPYQYAIAINSSGGTIDANSGAYTAGATPGTDTVAVSDALGSNAHATVVVSANNSPPVVVNPIPDVNGIYGAPFEFVFAADSFNDPDAGQSLTYSATGLPPGITFTPATRTFSGAPTGVGTNSVTVTATDNGSPALSTNDLFDIVIAKASLTATADNKSRTYAETNPPLTFSYSSFVLGEDASVLDTPPVAGTPATNGSATGVYPITVGGGVDDHYEFSYVGGTLNITPAALSVTADNTNRTYGALNPAFTGGIVGIANGDNITATFSTTADTNSPPGTYPITPALLDPDTKLGNYTVTTNAGTLIVTPAPLTVTANDTNRVYGTANPEFTGDVIGIVNGDNITAIFTTAATITDPPGAYAITPVFSDPDIKLPNYSVTTNLGTFTILSPPELSFTLGGGGGGLFTLSWPASYSGFELEVAESLTPPIDWQPVTSGITESGGIKSYTVTSDPNIPGRLYRLRLP